MHEEEVLPKQLAAFHKKAMMRSDPGIAKDAVT
jgi:hypothetical protein